MSNTEQTPVKRGARVTNHSGFVLKEDLPDGRQVWVHPAEMTEITLNPPSTPTPETLANLAANGIVPEIPTLDSLSSTFADPDLDDDESDTPLSRVLAKMQDSADPELRAEVRVYREKSDRSLSYCATFTPAQFDEGGNELIRAAFGPGKYRVRVYGPKPGREGNRGKFVHLTNELVEIEASAIPLKSNLPGLAGSGESGGVNQVMQAMQPILNMMQETQRQLLEIKQGNGGDKLAELMQMAELMRKLNGNNGGAQKSQSISEMLRELRELQKFDQSLKPAEKDGDDKEPSMLSLGMAVVDAIKNNAVVQQPQPGQPQLAGPAETQLQQPTEGDDVNSPEIFMANVMVSALMKAAIRGDKVTDHAPGLVNSLPEEILDMMGESLWFDLLCSTFPAREAELNTHRVWFTALRDEVVRLDKLANPSEAG